MTFDLEKTPVAVGTYVWFSGSLNTLRRLGTIYSVDEEKKEFSLSLFDSEEIISYPFTSLIATIHGVFTLATPSEIGIYLTNEIQIRTVSVALAEREFIFRKDQLKHILVVIGMLPQEITELVSPPSGLG